MINHLEGFCLESQWSHDRMDQVLVFRLTSLNIVLRPPLAKGGTHLLEIMDEFGEPGFSNKVVGTGTKKGEEASGRPFPILKHALVLGIGKEQPENMTFARSHGIEIDKQ